MEQPEKHKTAQAARRVLADGTYATESAFTAVSPTAPTTRAGKKNTRPPLRHLIMSGDYFLGAVLATCLTKLVLRAMKIGREPARVNQLRAEAMLILTGIITVGQSQFVHIPIDEDSYDRVLTCLRVLGNVEPELGVIFMEHCRAVYSKMVQEEEVSLFPRNFLVIAVMVTDTSFTLLPRKRKKMRVRRRTRLQRRLLMT